MSTTTRNQIPGKYRAVQAIAPGKLELTEKNLIDPPAGFVRIKIEAVSLDSTIVKVHPDGTGALKKTAPNPSANREQDGQPKFIWLPRMLGAPSRSR